MGSIPLRVLVCDDELMARKRVLRLLGELGGVEAAIECESGEQLLDRLREEEIDLAIVDVNMPNMSGIEAVLAMPEERPYVVFLTAHPEHAVKAFEWVSSTRYRAISGSPFGAPRRSIRTSASGPRRSSSW